MCCRQNKISVNNCSTTETCEITVVCKEFKTYNPFPRISNGNSIDNSSISRFNNFGVFEHWAILKILTKIFNILMNHSLYDFYLRVFCLKVAENNYHRHFGILFLHIQVHCIHIVPSKYVFLKIDMLQDIQSIQTK